MRKVIVDPCAKVIEIGRYGENEATAVYLPLAEFEKFTPGGTFSVLVRRPDVAEPSPVSFTVEGGYAIWVVGEDQLAVEGYGEVELRYVIGETRALSRVWSTHIGKSLLPELMDRGKCWLLSEHPPVILCLEKKKSKSPA